MKKRLTALFLMAAIMINSLGFTVSAAQSSDYEMSLFSTKHLLYINFENNTDETVDVAFVVIKTNLTTGEQYHKYLQESVEANQFATVFSHVPIDIILNENGTQFIMDDPNYSYIAYAYDQSKGELIASAIYKLQQ